MHDSQASTTPGYTFSDPSPAFHYARVAPAGSTLAPSALAWRPDAAPSPRWPQRPRLHLVPRAAISWASAKQPTVALSSCEAEIMALWEASKEALLVCVVVVSR